VARSADPELSVSAPALDLRGTFLKVVPLDSHFLETWAETWGIADRLDPYRSEYGPQD
jgi:hypothetical protein